MSIKNLIIYFVTFTITFFSMTVVIAHLKQTSLTSILWDDSNLIELWSSEKRLKELLDDEAYTLVDGVKIYKGEENIDSAIYYEITQTRQDLTSFLGPIKKTELNIIIFESLEGLREYSNLKSVGAFYSNKNRAIAVVMQITFDEEESNELLNLLKDLRHEYTHYYLATYLDEKQIKKVPTWFNEGLAEYVSITMNYGEEPLLRNEAINFTLIDTKSNWKKQRENYGQLYNQSHYAIDYLIKNNGEYVIRKILNDSGELKFEEAFFRNTNIEINDLHEYMN